MSKSFRSQSHHFSGRSSIDNLAVAQSAPARLSLKVKTTLMAVALGTLPVLALGITTYTFGIRSLDQQPTQLEQANSDEASEIRYLSILFQRQLQLTLLGTGITSIFAAAIAVLWAKRSVRPTVMAARAAASAAGALQQAMGDTSAPHSGRPPEDEIQSLQANLKRVVNQSQALLQSQQTEEQQFQLLTQISDRLRQSITPDALLETAVAEVRQVMGTDRVVFFRLEPNGDGEIAAEAVDSSFPPIKGSVIIDPCFKERHFGEYEQGRVRAIANIHQERLTQCHVDLLTKYAVKANLVAPVLFEGQLRGLLITHQCSRPYAWQPAEINFFSRLATQIGYALDQVSLVAERRITIEAERLLSETLSRVQDTHSTTAAMEAVVAETRQVLQADRVIFFSLTPDGEGTIDAESVAEGFPRIQGSVINDPCFKERHFEEYRQGRVRAIDNIHQASMTPCHINLLQQYAVKANLVAPVIRDRALVGLLIAHQCSRPRAWQPAEIRFFSRFASQTGYLLDRVGLISDRRVETETEQQIGKIIRSIRDARSPEETLDKVVNATREAIKADRVIFFRLEPNGDGLVEAESIASGFPAILGSSIIDPCFSERHIVAYRKGRVRAIDNIHQEKLTQCHVDLLSHYAVKANLVAPIICDGQLKGLLIAHQCSRPRTWQPSEVSFFSRLAIQVGYALDRRQFPIDEEAQAAAETFLTEITRRMRELSQADAILDTALDEIRQFLECDRTLFFQLKPDSDAGITTAESVANGFPETLGIEITDPCFNARYASLYQQGRVRAMDNIYDANLSECHLEMLRQFLVKSDLVAPVIRNGKLLGLLMAHQCSQYRTWQPVDIHVFAKLANQMGYALDRIYLLDQVEQAQHQIESSFFPQDRAFSSASLGITLADAQQPDYPLIYCNPAFESITGYAQQDLIGRNCRFLQGPDTDPEALEEIRKALREQRGCQVRLKNYRKDGSSFWNELNLAPIRDETGQVSHFIGIQMDVSQLQWDIQQMQTIAQTITQAVQDKQTVVGALSKDTSLQAEHLTSAAETSQSLITHIQSLTEITQNALSHAQQTHEDIATSSTKVAPIKADIAALQTVMQKSAEKIRHLAAITREVDSVIDPLQAFASQTNMLAMNLAVKAGGTEDSDSQSLITVAEAVRSLAEQADSATTEVSQVTGKIQTAIHETLAAMESDELLKSSLLSVEDIQRKLAKMLLLSNHNSQLIENIANTVPVCVENLCHLDNLTQEMTELEDQKIHRTALVADSYQQILEDIQILQTKADTL